MLVSVQGKAPRPRVNPTPSPIATPAASNARQRIPSAIFTWRQQHTVPIGYPLDVHSELWKWQKRIVPCGLDLRVLKNAFSASCFLVLQGSPWSLLLVPARCSILWQLAAVHPGTGAISVRTPSTTCSCSKNSGKEPSTFCVLLLH